MNAPNPSIDLGFAQVNVPPGSHVCQIFTETDERNDSLLKFLIRGLQDQERCACFSDDEFIAYFQEHFPTEEHSYKDCTQSGKLIMSNAEEHYFCNNNFDPDIMLNELASFHDESLQRGYSGVRVIGEMHPKILSVAGGERLLEYESRVNTLLKKHPITTVCQYNAKEFSGDVIMDVLKSHPMMVVRGMVVHNPYYEPRTAIDY